MTPRTTGPRNAGNNEGAEPCAPPPMIVVELSATALGRDG